MSTRSTISVLNKDNTVTSIYCHSDGYLQGVGYMLFTHYNTPEMVQELIALGDLSCLQENLNPLPIAPKQRWSGPDPAPMIEHHTFDDPQTGVTVAYLRDRNSLGEPAYEPWPTLADYFQHGCDQDFNYYYNGKWNLIIQEKHVVELTSEIVGLDVSTDVEVWPFLAEQKSADQFPNGFDDWQETHFEVVKHLIHTEDNEGSMCYEERAKGGWGAVYLLAKALTDEFETIYKGTVWGEELEWFDTLEMFLMIQEKERYTQKA